MIKKFVVFIVLSIGFSIAVKINFSSCQDPEWSCVSNVPFDVTYSCSTRNDYEIHIKDFYTNLVSSITIENCKELKVLTDCPSLQRNSQLQRFVIKNVEKLEFISSNGSPVQTPAEVIIENVEKIVSLPRKLFKSPNGEIERKCFGANSMRRIRFLNSNINLVSSEAIHNVTDTKSIEFENVTITNVQTLGIEAIMSSDNAVFKFIDTKIDNVEFKAITVQSAAVLISESNFGDIHTNSINITSEYLQFTGNTIKQINAYGLTVKSIKTDISRNDILTLKANALSNVKCARRRLSRKVFNFSNNKVENLEPYSLIFDYDSCRSAGTVVSFDNNKLDCRCRNIAFLNLANSNVDLNNIILDVTANNTCLSAPCLLPIDIVKMLLENDMCQLNLDLQVMCLLYNDRNNKVEATTDEEVTEPPPTLYLIRHANSPNGIASMTAVNKDDLLRDSNLTNRTAIKVVFDSSRDFVETLRNTSNSRKVNQEPKQTEEYINRCVGATCRDNVAYDKQKALDFYKYIYAQLRQPRQNDSKKKK